MGNKFVKYFIYNFIYHNKKENTDKYRCKEYKTNFYCNAFICLKDDKIQTYNNKHTHISNNLDIIREEARKKIKNTISLAEDPFTINVPKLYKNYSVDKGLRAPSFSSIKSSLYNEVNKNLPKDILSLKNAPCNSPFYKTLDNNDFVIYKDNSMVILQSPNLAKIHLKLGSVLFFDATFFVAPSFAYQMFITRAYSETTNSYYTTSFSIMQSKKEKDYIKVFQKIHNNINLYLDIGEKYEVKEIHTDFEYAISNACQKVYPNVKKNFVYFIC